MRIRRRLLAPLVALGVLLIATPVAAAPGSLGRQAEPDAPAASGPDPFDRLAGCIGASGRLLVVLLVDESGSLNSTDPEGQRVQAAQAAVASLDRLRSVDIGGTTPEVDIQVAVFSNEFIPLGEWTPLNDTTLPGVQRSVDSLEGRNQGRDTDFHNALDGARASLADRAVAAGAGGEVCKSILLFTDGDFAIGPRTTPADLETYGATKTYAPEIVLDSDEAVRDARQAGIEALCDPAGVADQVRSDRITLVTVPLTNNLREGAQRLIEAITTGAAVDRECGDPATDNPGVYLPAADPEELLRVFDGVGARIAGGSITGPPVEVVPCADEVCTEGSAAIEVAPSQRRVRIFVTVPGPASQVLLVPPDDEDPLELESGEAATDEIVGVPVTVEWLSARSATIDLAVPPDGTGAGTWRVVVVGREGEDTATISIITFSDVVAALTGGSLSLGSAAELVAEIVSQSGTGEVPEFETATITATILDPITGRSIITDSETGDAKALLFGQEAEEFLAEVTVPADVTAAAVTMSLRLQATTEAGAVVTSVSPEIDLPVRRPEGYPQLAPARLDLSGITGDEAAEGELVLVAAEGGAGCAWLDDLEVSGAPRDAGEFSIEATGIGRAEGSCTPIEGPVTVPISVMPAERASGTVSGHVRLFLAQADGAEPIATDVPVSFEMATGVDEAKRIALAAGLLVAGLLLPLILLTLLNLATTRFQTLAHVRAAKVPVVLMGRGQILRVDGERRGLRLLGGDFHELEGEGGHRHFTWGGLVFRARTPLNPFGEPYAAVSPEGGTADVAREGRRSDLALGLTGSWLFLLDQDATSRATDRFVERQGGGERPSEPPEIHGQLVAFIAKGPVPAQASRLIEDIDARLPATARELARLAKL